MHKETVYMKMKLAASAYIKNKNQDIPDKRSDTSLGASLSHVDVSSLKGPTPLETLSFLSIYYTLNFLF